MVGLNRLERVPAWLERGPRAPGGAARAGGFPPHGVTKDLSIAQGRVSTSNWSDQGREIAPIAFDHRRD